MSDKHCDTCIDQSCTRPKEEGMTEAQKQLAEALRERALEDSPAGFYQIAREGFDRYGTKDRPDEKFEPFDMHPTTRAAVRHERNHRGRWGFATVYEQVVVLSEEVGELVEAWGPGPDFDTDAIRHELGDVLSSMAVLAVWHRLDFSDLLLAAERPEIATELLREAKLTPSRLSPSTALGRVARAAVKGERKLRGLDDTEKVRRAMFDSLVLLACALSKLAWWMKWDLGHVFRETVDRLQWRWEQELAPRPICSTCDDTHRMPYADSKVNCTRCPSPCDRCRGANGLGAYCAATPCACACHRKAAS